MEATITAAAGTEGVITAAAGMAGTMGAGTMAAARTFMGAALISTGAFTTGKSSHSST